MLFLSIFMLNGTATAKKMANTYHYVGENPIVCIFAPYDSTSISIYNENETLLLSEQLAAGTVVNYFPTDLGISGIAYVRIEGSEPFACTIGRSSAGWTTASYSSTTTAP